ncbi:tyrosine recombinase XerC [Patescibacteria group bacterium]|nr:tyrosine recombinase XerC [Patescibacteria group bacterium]MBU0777127.1 tyrosine recombinase XerC [Patescibacteria group bacterium]MBU0922848.1 tyrosine recombinase XerC [Patescibacteria group bacterium]MBU1844471.1 tyrosine recombinase XerC [Patescibacteria group bacterium]
MPTVQSSKKVSPLIKLCNNFLEYLEIEKGASPLTIRNYKHYLNRLCSWMEKAGIRQTPKDINPEVIRQYRVYLSRISDGKGGTLSRKTQGFHVIALRSFLKWMIRNDLEVMSPDKIELPKINERQIKFLSGEQVDRLLNAPSLSTIQGKRDKAILEVLFSTGLRVSELVSLDRDKIDFKRREFGILGKGGKTRVVFLSSRAVEWIEKYLKARNDRYKPLFVRHKGKMDPSLADEKMRLSPRSVQRMIKKYSRKMKLPIDVTPHVLRHSFATDLLMAGADLRSVQEMLGHKNVSTTQIYTHVTHKHLRDIHSAFHGKGGD